MIVVTAPAVVVSSHLCLSQGLVVPTSLGEQHGEPRAHVVTPRVEIPVLAIPDAGTQIAFRVAELSIDHTVVAEIGVRAADVLMRVRRQREIETLGEVVTSLRDVITRSERTPDVVQCVDSTSRSPIRRAVASARSPQLTVSVIEPASIDSCAMLLYAMASSCPSPSGSRVATARKA